MGSERTKQPHHPTQKPIRILQRLLEIASNPGDLILDPFMGVGSTGVAATNLGRRFLGAEIDTQYFHAAQKRLQQQTAIFEQPVT